MPVSTRNEAVAAAETARQATGLLLGAVRLTSTAHLPPVQQAELANRIRILAETVATAMQAAERHLPDDHRNGMRAAAGKALSAASWAGEGWRALDMARQGSGAVTGAPALRRSAEAVTAARQASDTLRNSPKIRNAAAAADVVTAIRLMCSDLGLILKARAEQVTGLPATGFGAHASPGTAAMRMSEAAAGFATAVTVLQTRAGR